ncbi:MAG: hypothetical protein ACPLZY_04075 [Candidatus Norongarragalinales archaeon]
MDGKRHLNAASLKQLTLAFLKLYLKNMGKGCGNRDMLMLMHDADSNGYKRVYSFKQCLVVGCRAPGSFAWLWLEP